MVFKQIGLAMLFYFLVVCLFRLSGKRFAGQVTTFDLVILITLSVTLQKITLLDGTESALIFIVTIFILHTLVGQLTQRSATLRHFLRGRACLLVENGRILKNNLDSEKLSVEDLSAGLRKMGIDDITAVKSAYLEETGQISAIRCKLT